MGEVERIGRKRPVLPRGQPLVYIPTACVAQPLLYASGHAGVELVPRLTSVTACAKVVYVCPPQVLACRPCLDAASLEAALSYP